MLETGLTDEWTRPQEFATGGHCTATLPQSFNDALDSTIDHTANHTVGYSVNLPRLAFFNQMNNTLVVGWVP